MTGDAPRPQRQGSTEPRSRRAKLLLRPHAVELEGLLPFILAFWDFLHPLPGSPFGLRSGLETARPSAQDVEWPPVHCQH